jgi:hypothetical protein
VRTHTQRSRAARFWAALVALAVLVPATLAVATTSAGAAGSNTLTIKAGEYTYILKGKPKAGWTEITFDNAGVEDHMVAMFKLKKGTTNAQLKKAVLSEDDSAFEAIVAPGGDPTVQGTPNLLTGGKKTTTYTQLPAGTYGIACFIPAATDGKSHAEHGMYKVFTVSGKSNAKPPTDGVSEVSISDSGITLPDNGLPGHGWVKVTNESSVSRDLALAEYTSDSATFDEANNYYNTFFSTGKAPEGDPPATLNGGVSGLAAGGGSGYFELDLSNGRYVLVSSNDEADNDPNPLHADFDIG